MILLQVPPAPVPVPGGAADPTATVNDPSAFVGDPLWADGVDATAVLIALAKVVLVFVLVLVSVMLYVWFMRRVIGRMQNRPGPNRAGPFGILQTLADGVKLFFKEHMIPDRADRPVYLLAPYLSIIPALLAFSLIPIGGEVTVFGKTTYLQVANLPIGVLFVLAMSGLGLYGVMLAGWSSGSKYPLLGSVRASAQLLSYEGALGLAIVGVLIQAGTLSTRAIVDEQGWTGWGSVVGDWFWLPALIPFVIFIIAAIAETNHPPFDLVEAEQELVGGFHTEYTGIRFAIFFLAEFMNVITLCALAVTLFLGGPAGPHIEFASWLWPIVWFTLKLWLLLFGTVWIRATLPRMRYDQLMGLGWKYLIEIAVLWALVAVTVVVAREENWNLWIAVPIAAAVALLAYAVLWASMSKSEDLESAPGEVR
ncbi:MAG: NADH-quinone oxidoreductase subunit NuoH [Acidimicrobiia bacterium]|nr:NADH-quinone oxidoreductase subunit NuoH [Acidimicrobiia bacterium]